MENVMSRDMIDRESIIVCGYYIYYTHLFYHHGMIFDC